MAVAVVERFEIVNIDDQQRQCCSRCQSLPPFPLQCFIK
jgi:hypothetical protein